MDENILIGAYDKRCNLSGRVSSSYFWQQCDDCTRTKHDIQVPALQNSHRKSVVCVIDSSTADPTIGLATDNMLELYIGAQLISTQPLRGHATYFRSCNHKVYIGKPKFRLQHDPLKYMWAGDYVYTLDEMFSAQRLYGGATNYLFDVNPITEMYASGSLLKGGVQLHSSKHEPIGHVFNERKYKSVKFLDEHSIVANCGDLMIGDVRKMNGVIANVRHFQFW